MLLASDVYIETNPALAALTLHAFCKGYIAASERMTPYPLMFLPVPICMSAMFRPLFGGTNRDTGLLEWQKRNPEIYPELAEKVSETTELTQNGMLVGLQLRLLSVDDEGQFGASSVGIKSNRALMSTTLVQEITKTSERMGYWLGRVRSTRLVFNSLGFIP